MASEDKSTKEIGALEENIIRNLTVNDALILIVVCAAKEKTEINESQADDAKRIAALAKKHPIVNDLEESIDGTINKFMNMGGTTTNLLNSATSAASTLEKAEKAFGQEIKKTAFSWIGEIIMPDGVLTEERKTILDKYALLLNIDNTIAQQILVEVSR